MSRILMLYGTTDGHTAKVASVIAGVLRTRGCEVDVVCAAAPGAAVRAASYDAVIVAASVHAGGFQRAVGRWLRGNAVDLAARPTAFVAVCLAILESRVEARTEIHRIVERFLSSCGWKPGAVKLVAGAVPYTRYGWLKKRIMRRICARTGGGTDMTRDFEYTDWNAVRSFARGFADAQGLTPPDRAPVLAAH